MKQHPLFIEGYKRRGTYFAQRDEYQVPEVLGALLGKPTDVDVDESWVTIC